MANNRVTDIKNPFKEVFEALDLKEQRKAMKGAMRREGNRVKRAAVANLSSSPGGKGGRPLGAGTRQKVSRGIYVRTYPERYGTGFMASVKPHGRIRGVHQNRQGYLKPVLMWAEDGTRSRNVGRRKKSFFSSSRWSGAKVRNYKRSGHSTGYMRGYHFLEKTERETADGVENRIFDDFRKNIDKAARKRGLLD